jgi:lysophospholipase L1-like esterase
MGVINKQLFEYHPIIGYRFIPNLQTRIQHESGGYLVKTNNLGFRSEMEFNNIKEKGYTRILLFGDSFTAGDGVSNKKRYSDLLMKMLPSTEIYNFGMPGTGTDQQYLLYREFARNIEHDLVMIVVLVENIRRVNAKHWFFYNDKKEKIVFQKPYFKKEKKELVLKNVPVNPIQWKFDNLPESEREKGRHPAIKYFINKFGLKKLKKLIANYQPLPQYGSSANSEWLLLKAILSKWIAEVHKPVLLIPLPIHDYLEEKSNYKNIENRFKEFNCIENVTLYSPFSDLKKYNMDQRRKFRFEQDTHPTSLGHEAYANAFKSKIEELLIKKPA